MNDAILACVQLRGQLAAVENTSDIIQILPCCHSQRSALFSAGLSNTHDVWWGAAS